MPSNHGWREAKFADRGKTYTTMDVGSHQLMLGTGPLLPPTDQRGC